MPKDLDKKNGVLNIKFDNKFKKGRKIPIEKASSDEMRKWIEETGFLCPYKTTDGAQTVLSKYAKKIGLVSNPKKLRSTFDSIMVQEDANPFRLAEIMGNSIKILQDYYVAHNQKKITEEILKNPLRNDIFRI